MRSGLAGLFATQGGVFARRQAIARGYTPREFDSLTRPRGEWVRVRYGTYTTRDLWESLDEGGRWLLRDRAALLVCNDNTVLSHSSSARLLPLPLYGVADGLSHVTRLGPGQSFRVQSGIMHHLSDLDLSRVMRRDGLLLADPIQTVADLSREFGYRTGLVAADAALREGASHQEMLARAAAMTTQPRGPIILAVAQDADGRAENPLETLGRILLTNMGIADLELQWRIDFPGGGYAVVDLYSPALDHVFETDGRVKYQEQFDSRGRLVTPSEIVWKEKQREDKVRGQGHGMSRIVWPDVEPGSFQRASRRLWAEIHAQRARGLRLPRGA